MREKIVQLLQFQDCILCLTEDGKLYRYNPFNNDFTFLSSGI